MIKHLTTGICILAFTSTLAFAQASQGQAGASTVPTGTNAQIVADPMKSNAKMKKSKKTSMKKGDGMTKSDGMKKDSMSK
ncbi:hypothetical protein BH11PSE4_BH11PSE4_28780 [soil metagenome]